MSENRLNFETSFAVNEGCKSEEQHNVRCKGNSFWDGFQKRHSFRLWQILLFLFVVAAIIVLTGLLSPGVFGRKRTTVTNGRKYNKNYKNVQLKESLNLCEEVIKRMRLNLGS